MKILVIILEGIGDNILSLPFLNTLCKNKSIKIIDLLIGAGRGDIFLGIEGCNTIEMDETLRCRGLPHKKYDIIYDLSTGDRHIIEKLDCLKIKWSKYVCFKKSTTIRNEIATLRAIEVPMWKQFISLLQHAGIHNTRNNTAEFVIKEYEQRFADLLIEPNPALPIVCIAPGARSCPKKALPSIKLSKIIEYIDASEDVLFVLIGSAEDINVGNDILSKCNVNIENLIGLTTLGSAAHILRKAILLLTNDNGIMHLAGLLNTPIVALFGPTNSCIYGPMGENAVIIKSHTGAMDDIENLLVAENCLALIKESVTCHQVAG